MSRQLLEELWIILSRKVKFIKKEKQKNKKAFVAQEGPGEILRTCMCWESINNRKISQPPF